MFAVGEQPGHTLRPIYYESIWYTLARLLRSVQRHVIVLRSLTLPPLWFAPSLFTPLSWLDESASCRDERLFTKH